MKDQLSAREAKWLAAHGPLDLERYGAQLLVILRQVQEAERMPPDDLRRILGRHLRDGKSMFSKHELVRGYRALCERGQLAFERETLRRLQMKPTRTQSGVTPVTVLTKPAPCPGQCIFCPTDARMPQSYLADEPGAMRGAYHSFDPFEQSAARIQALENIGHPTDKIELLILGGTWSAYEAEYQEHFVRRCLDAMNERPAPSLPRAQEWNESAPHRCVGLVVETRPDCITPAELRRLRRLGVTKVQLGLQSLDDAILAANGRGHSMEQSRQAMRLLRLAGFKIAAHWMPNLLGATLASDRADFMRLWDDPALRPDELNIYPCALLADTPLHKHWQRGDYQPYDEQSLVRLVADCKALVPPYCRINRIARDIPAPHIVAGSTRANLRQIAQQHLAAQGRACRCIRCREVRRQRIEPASLQLQTLIYPTDLSLEYFLNVVTPQGKLAGFLRLSLPRRREQVALALRNCLDNTVDEINDCAMIREIHVYGPALSPGSASHGDAQHSGIGSRLIKRAQNIACSSGYRRLAVIAATGTRNYYRRRGFQLGELYMAKDI